MKRSFPKDVEEFKGVCSFTLDELCSGSLPDDVIVNEYLHDRFDIFDLRGRIDEPDSKSIQAATIIANALCRVPLEVIVKMIKSEDIEICSSDHVPLINNLEDPLFVELSFLKGGPKSYETLGGLMPGCNAIRPDSRYKYGEICSKLLSLLDLVWIYKDDGTKVMLSPMGIVFNKLSLQKRCILFKKLILRIDVIRNILRAESGAGFDVVTEVSKWVHGSTVGRRSPSVVLLLNELIEPQVAL